MARTRRKRDEILSTLNEPFERFCERKGYDPEHWPGGAWGEFRLSPEYSDYIRTLNHTPRITHPYENFEVGIADSRLANWGAHTKPQGARRMYCTPNLAREYARTHEEIREWEKGLINDRGEYVDDDVEAEFTCMGYLRKCENAVTNRNYRLCKDCIIARDWDLYEYDMDDYWDIDHDYYAESWHKVKALQEVAHVLRDEGVTHDFDAAMKQAEKMLA